MASEVKTNKLSPSTGVTVTLGDASDVFQLPASAEIDIASGATLDVNGTIDVTGATTTGFPSGLSTASQWRLTTDFTGDVTPIASNLEEVDAPVGFGVLGSSMTQSSGVFVFPSTGYWLIQVTASWNGGSGGSGANHIKIQTTIDNTAGPTWADASIVSEETGGASSQVSTACNYIFDVTNVTECRCRFSIDVTLASTITKGDTAFNETHFTFVKLADT